MNQKLLSISEKSPLSIGSILKNDLDARNFLDSHVMGSTSSYTEKLYCYINSIYNTPLCPICKVEKLSFISITRGYRKCCGNLDCIKSIRNVNKFIETIKHKNDIEYTIPDSIVFDRDFIIDFVENNMIRKDGNINGNLIVPYKFVGLYGEEIYGKVFCDYVRNISEYKSFSHYYFMLKNGQHYCTCGNKSTFINFKKGFLQFCSTLCANNNKDKIETIRTKLLSDEAKVRNKDRNDHRKKIRIEEQTRTIISEGYSVLGYEDERFDLKCGTCSNTFNSTFSYRRCYVCEPLVYSKEYEISQYFDKSVTNIKSVLKYKRLQLDCYMQEIKLAVEYDGLIWHSYGKHNSSLLNNYMHEDRFEHLKKTELCEDIDIKLFRVWSNEWENDITRNIWISKFRHEQGKSIKIFARKTKIVSVDSKTAKEFLEFNHLQGSCISAYNYGLEYNGELVMLMTIGKSRFDKKYDYELLRMCSKIDTSVIGGAMKLLSHVKKHHSGRMISYANRRWSSGNVYSKMGFNLVKKTSPGYYYTDNINVYSRQKFQKHKLEHILPTFDETLTEKDNMFNNGYRRIWDCGNLVFEIDLDQYKE